MDENSIVGFIRGLGGFFMGIVDFLAQTSDFLCGFLVVAAVIGVGVVKVASMVLGRIG